MSSALTPAVLNPLSTSNAFLISLPSIFPTKTSPHPSCLAIPPKPINLHLPSLSSHSSFLSLKTKTQSFKLVPLVARTSDWAQQEEDDTAVVDEEEEETEFSWGEGEKAEAVGGESESGGEEGFVGGQGEYREPSEEAKLFVGNLPWDLDSEKLAQFFDQAGVVEVAEVIYNRETDQSRGFGFVTMSTVEEAEKAVEMFHKYDLNGRLLTVNKASPRGSERSPSPPRDFGPSYKVFVANLPWDVDNERLGQLFSKHGNVVDARVIYDRESGRSRGFGFVTMATAAEMNDAVAQLDGQEIGGRPIRVNVAEDRPRRTF